MYQALANRPYRNRSKPINVPTKQRTRSMGRTTTASNNVLQLQRMIGNQAVNRLLYDQRIQRSDDNKNVDNEAVPKQIWHLIRKPYFIETVNSLTNDTAKIEWIQSVLGKYAAFDSISATGMRMIYDLFGIRVPENSTTFKLNDSSTWEMAGEYELLGINESDLDAVTTNVQDELMLSKIKNGQYPLSPVTGVAYHAHMLNGGTGGIAFCYHHLGGNKVQAVIYDVATTRTGNKYNWRKAGSRSSGAPNPPSNIKAMQNV